MKRPRATFILRLLRDLYLLWHLSCLGWRLLSFLSLFFRLWFTFFKDTGNPRFCQTLLGRAWFDTPNNISFYLVNCLLVLADSFLKNVNIYMLTVTLKKYKSKDGDCLIYSTWIWTELSKENSCSLQLNKESIDATVTENLTSVWDYILYL